MTAETAIYKVSYGRERPAFRKYTAPAEYVRESASYERLCTADDDTGQRVQVLRDDANDLFLLVPVDAS